MELLFITSNKGKVEEARRYLKDSGVRVVQRRFEYPEIQASELEKVVEFALNWLKNRVDKPFFIDDSGLFIEALHGFPGVYSAYVYKTLGNDGILRLMDKIEDRRAYFKSVIGYYDGKVHIFTGIVKGEITFEKKGTMGFGFDPIFVPDGFKKTFAEMTTEEKNKISHRGKALRVFSKWLKENLI